MDLNLPSDVKVEKERDSVGRGALASDVYKGVVELVYLDKSAGGAISVNIQFKTQDQVVNQTVYISNRKGKFTYAGKNGDAPLPGYSQMDAFFTALTGKNLAQQAKEDKVINLYDFEARKELPVKREVFIDALNLPIACGITLVKEEKTTKESNYKEGTGEYYTKNEFNKWFDADTGLTAVEKQAGETSPKFLEAWKTKFVGETITRNAKNSGAVKGAPATAAAAKPTTSLFT